MTWLQPILVLLTGSVCLVFVGSVFIKAWCALEEWWGRG